MVQNDNVFRALSPRMAFERPDGSISPAAFKDKKGLSVEIGLSRSDQDVVKSMHSYLEGNILKIGISVCKENEIEIYNDHSPNKYHRLLLNEKRINNDLRLTPEQCYALATAESNVLLK